MNTITRCIQCRKHIYHCSKSVVLERMKGESSEINLHITTFLLSKTWTDNLKNVETTVMATSWCMINQYPGEESLCSLRKSVCTWNFFSDEMPTNMCHYTTYSTHWIDICEIIWLFCLTMNMNVQHKVVRFPYLCTLIDNTYKQSEMQ